MSYINKLRQLLNNPRISTFQALSFIKSEVSTTDYYTAINLNPALVKAKLAGDTFFRLEDIFQRDPCEFTNDLKRELHWIYFNIRNHAVRINQFIEQKSQFEQLFLLSEYNEAEKILQSIRKQFGENLWTIEMDLLLKEFAYDTKENWTRLSYYLSNIKSPFYQFLISFFSKRIEVNMSFENCMTQFQNDFNGVEADNIVDDFLVFKSLLIANFEYTFKDLEGVLYISNIFSVIDQYLILVEVLLKLGSNNSKNDKLILPLANKIYKTVSGDERLANMINLLENKPNIVKLKYTDTVLPVLDHYSIGNHERCLQLCETHLATLPHIFELYEVYCKSLITLQREFQPVGQNDLVNNILSTVYNALLFDSNSDSYRNKLLKYSLTFLSFDFGKQLAAFATNLVEDPIGHYHSLIGCLSSKVNNPRILTLELDDRKEHVLVFNG